jgi:hypothetical protein
MGIASLAFCESIGDLCIDGHSPERALCHTSDPNQNLDNEGLFD